MACLAIWIDGMGKYHNIRVMKHIKQFVIIGILIWGMALSAEEQEKTSEDYINQLGTTDQNVKVEAIRALGERKEEKAVPSLIKILKEDQSMNLRRNAAISLALIGKPGETTDALLAVIKDSGQPVLQYTAVLALVVINDEDKKADVKGAIQWVSENTTDEKLMDLSVKMLKRFQ